MRSLEVHPTFTTSAGVSLNQLRTGVNLFNPLFYGMIVGLFSHSQVYSTKFINAEIMHTGKRVYVMPIKHVIGDYFLATIEKKVYAFRMTGDIYTYHHFGQRTIRKMYFTTKHYRPISFENNKELENILRTNQLPHIDRTLFATFKYLGKREKMSRNRKTGEEKFEPHDLESLVAEIAEKQDVFSEQAKNLITYLESLNIDQIITPVKQITEFLEADFIATDPKFLGDLLLTAEDTDKEHKFVTNVPIKGKGPMMKIIAIAAIIGLVGVVGLIGYNEGWFNNLGAGIVPNFGPAKQTPPQCGTPEGCKAAIDRGEVKKSDLPPELQKLIDAVKPPTVTPKQNTVTLTP